jgi:hypothetical protein
VAVWKFIQVQGLVKGMQYLNIDMGDTSKGWRWNSILLPKDKLGKFDPREAPFPTVAQAFRGVVIETLLNLKGRYLVITTGGTGGVP